MKVTHRTGEVCDHYQKAIGDKGSNTTAIYSVDSWSNPGRQIKLCKKDLDRYQQYVREERQGLANLV